MLGTIEKAGRVLDLFSSEHAEWGVTEVASELNMPKTNAHAVLATLREIGLLRKTGNGRYRLGWRLVSLNHSLVESTEFRLSAGKRMQRTVDRIHKTMHLAVLVDSEVVYLDKRSSSRSMAIPVSGTGKNMPAHCTAVGKVLLAEPDATPVEQLVDHRGLRKLTERTISNPTALERELEKTRARGFGLDLEESVMKLCCVAAPIRDPQGSVQAALSISVPEHNFRLNPSYYTDVVQSLSREVTLSWPLQ